MAENKIACVHVDSPEAAQSHDALNKLHELVSPEEADVIVVLGGDGFMLESIHAHAHLGKPFFGLNFGTVGFLMNNAGHEDLYERIQQAKTIHCHPLHMRALTMAGEQVECLAFNEVSVTRHSGQSANCSISINGTVQLDKFVGDGIIVSTPMGSTAYNYSAYGPIIPLGSHLMALTPVSPFRPRRWKGALLPNNSVIEIENLAPSKRPLGATADFEEVFDVVKLSVRKDEATIVRMLFDAGHTLEERIIAEQFAF